MRLLMTDPLSQGDILQSKMLGTQAKHDASINDGFLIARRHFAKQNVGNSGEA